MKKQVWTVLAALLAAIGVKGADLARVKTYDVPFPDVAAGAWYADDVKTAFEVGLMNGDDTGAFLPDDGITAAEAVTVAARAGAAAKGETIPDAEGAWYTGYVNYARATGILTDGLFADGDFDRPAKRKEVARLFAHALPEDGYAVINDVTSIPDVTESRGYYADVLKLYRAGILMGSDAQGTFYGENDITRAEIAAVISRAAIAEKRLQRELDKVSGDDAYLLITCRSMRSEKEAINSGWMLDNRGGTPRTSYNAVYGALFDIDEHAGTQYIREFNEITTGVITLETTATIGGYDGVSLGFYNEAGIPVYLLFTENGDWYTLTEGGQKVKVFDIDPNALSFSFKLVVDLDNARSTTFINGKDCGTYALASAGSVWSFRFATDKEHTSVLSPGGVTAYVNYPVYGTLTAAGNGSLVESFAPLGGEKAISEFLLKPKKSGEFVYALLSGDKTAARFVSTGEGFFVNGEKVYGDYYTTMYYRMRLELDYETMTVLVKVNGRRVAEVPFTDEVTSIDRIVCENGYADGVSLIRCRTFREINHDDYVPVPVAPKGEDKYTVGINVCSLWRNGYAPQGGWSVISPFDDRQPVLGYYDEGVPETADWEIKYLLEHGVDFQAFCVYFGSRVAAEQLEAYHLFDGFMNAKYSDMTKFAVIWEAAGGQVPANMDVWKEHYVPFFIENFFKDERYMVIDNKPLLIVFGSGSLVSAFGDNYKVKEAFDYLDGEVKKLGYDGVLKLNCASKSSVAYREMGFDGVYAYGWGVGGSSAFINTSYMTDSAEVPDGAYTVPVTSVGFNSVPWDGVRRSIMPREQFIEVQRFIKDDFLPHYAKQDWQKNFLMMSNWNEYGEGTYLMPVTDPDIGFRYLDVLREEYTDEAADPAINIVPTQAQKARITHLYPQYRRLLKKQAIEKEELHEDKLVPLGKVTRSAYRWVLNIDNLVQDDNGISGHSTGNDPVIMLHGVNDDIDLDRVVAISMTFKVPKGNHVEIFYKTAAEDNWGSARSFPFLSESDDWQTVMLSTSNKPGWTGKFTGFRVDPCTVPGVDFTVKELVLYGYTDDIPSCIMNINESVSRLSFSPFYEGKDLYVAFEPVTGMDFQLDLFYLWDKDNGILTLYGADHEMVFTVGSDVYTLDGRKETLSAPLRAIDGLPCASRSTVSATRSGMNTG